VDAFNFRFAKNSTMVSAAYIIVVVTEQSRLGKRPVMDE
jgi:hypothetical protein